MKDLELNSMTKTIQMTQDDIGYVRDDEQLAQSVWTLLNTNLSNIIPGNGIVILGKQLNEEYISNVISRLLVDFDERIATTQINSISFSNKNRTLKIGLKIGTKEGGNVEIGGNLDVG
ncbi:MAG: hypothetical protein [Caudoviricetes sp.]|nr:MAG: hypothetical protein [Caudoviricetes sp.]